MKLARLWVHVRVWLVAPCVGAWIETSIPTFWIRLLIVAPCVGAWIETPVIVCFVANVTNVAPCVGAWIET